MTDNSSAQHILPVADHNFTVTHSTGMSAHHNLEKALHHATLSTSSSLHSIKPHINTIVKAFDNQVIKHAIRSGGLSETQKKAILTKIRQSDPKIQNNTLVKNAIKKVIKHFTKESQAAANTKRIYRNLPPPTENEQHITNIAQMGDKKTTTANQNITTGKTFSSNARGSQTLTSIGQAGKIPLSPPSTPKSFTRPTLVA